MQIHYFVVFGDTNVTNALASLSMYTYLLMHEGTDALMNIDSILCADLDLG